MSVSVKAPVRDENTLEDWTIIGPFAIVTRAEWETSEVQTLEDVESVWIQNTYLSNTFP